MSTERRPVAFTKFGGLRLDLPIDEIGGEAAQYLRDVDWDGSTGRLRARDGFAKLKAADSTGPYKGLFAHSALRLLAVKRVKSTEVKIVAVDREGTEKTTATWPEAEATSCFTRFGTPSASYTYCRANLPTAKVVRFDGTEFKEPTCSVDGVSGKEMPRGKIMLTWPDGGNRLIALNTAAAGGPGGAASSASHGWLSEPGNAEAYESTAYIQFSPGDGEEITAGAVFGGMVFVFKETKFFVIYGVSTDEEGRPVFSYREVSLGEGSRMKRPAVAALAESSDQLACNSSEGVYFCTSDGVWLTTGSTPTKISQALRPLEEVSPFDGPMAEFLNGATEVFRWPAAGIACLGKRLIVRRYEFTFILDIPTGQWTCWKMPAVSMAIWTGLTGGGGEIQPFVPPTKVVNDATVGAVAWKNPESAKVVGTGAEVEVHEGEISQYLKASNFGFSIPTTDTIFGVSFSVRTTRFAFLYENSVKLVKGGTVSGSEIGTHGFLWEGGGIEHPEGVMREWGGPTNLGGLTLAPSDVNATGFGCAISVYSGSKLASAHVSELTMTIYFGPTEAASGVRPRLFYSQSKSIFFTAPGVEEQAGVRDAEWQSGFYDLGNADEKTVVEDKMFGRGVVDLSAFSDFSTSPDPQYPIALTMPTVGIGQARSHLSQPSATVLSHKLFLEPGAQVQRLTRYIREGRTPTTETKR